jgi:hypothetical protein
LGNSGQPSGSGLAPIRPSGPQPPHSSAAREQEERFLDFQALLQDEQQQNTSQNGTLRDFSDSWRRVSVPPPNVNPFNDRARPSVIQMSPSVLPSGRNALQEKKSQFLKIGQLELLQTWSLKLFSAKIRIIKFGIHSSGIWIFN